MIEEFSVVFGYRSCCPCCRCHLLSFPSLALLQTLIFPLHHLLLPLLFLPSWPALVASPFLYYWYHPLPLLLYCPPMSHYLWQNISIDAVLGLPKTLRKYAIGLVLGSSLPNWPLYRVNLTEHAELKRQVDFNLSNAEVFYNTSVNRTTNGSPYHEIAYAFRPKQLTHLISIPDHYNVSEYASSFASSVASHVHELYKKISYKVAQSNADYKLWVDVRNILKTFNVSDVKKLILVVLIFQVLKW